MPVNDVLLDKGGAVFNVKAYGATGNGVTDDASAIQTTIQACAAAGGGTVYFPAGTYRAGAVLQAGADNVWLVGAGPASTIASTLTSGNTIEFTGHRSGCGVRSLRLAPAVTKIAGNEIAAPDFYVLWLTDLWFENCYRCISMGTPTTLSVIAHVKNIRAINYRQFAYLTRILDFWFDSLSLAAANSDVVSIRLDGGCEGGSFSNGDIVNIASDSGKTGCVLHIKAQAYTETPPRWIAYSNFYFDSHGEGVVGESGYGHTFTNCWFSNRPGNGVAVTGSATDYAFVSCIFANNGAQGVIFYAGSGHSVLNSYVVGNAQSVPADGIAVGSTVTGIRIQGVHTFNEWGLGGNQAHGIKVYGGAQNVMILDNHLGMPGKVNQNGGVRLETGSDYLIVKNNIARGYALGQGVSNSTSAAPSRIITDNLV